MPLLSDLPSSASRIRQPGWVGAGLCAAFSARWFRAALLHASDGAASAWHNVHCGPAIHWRRPLAALACCLAAVVRLHVRRGLAC